MILFAYASNMNVKDFATNIQSARKIGNACIRGYEFVFNKTASDNSAKANIVVSENAGAAVWGVIIEFNENDAPFFLNGDWDEHLELKLMDCEDEAGNVRQANVFITKPHGITQFLLPYDWYKEKIVRLATLNCLPVYYISTINSMESKPDPDVQRQNRRIKNFNNSLL